MRDGGVARVLQAILPPLPIYSKGVELYRPEECEPKMVRSLR